jgi:putative oxidoreductase
MERWLGRYSETLYAVMRLMTGTAFACHGAQKLFGAFGSSGASGNPMMLTAGVIEFFGGLLIAIGLLTSYAAFLASGQMAVAYFMAHAPNGYLPILNKGELAVVYCFLFLYVSSRGSGALSVDRALRGSGRG